MTRRRPTSSYLGELEIVVLATLARPEVETYGVGIRRDIEERTGRDVSIGAIYATLRRLEDKRYVASALGEPSPERGGRAKKFFRLLPAGEAALGRSRRMMSRALDGLDGLAEGLGS